MPWIAGVWFRRSLGIRGKDNFHGWYQRIRERANGSRTGLLERLIEAIRGSGFSVEQSQAIIAAYDKAMVAMQSAATETEIGGRALLVNAIDENAAAFWMRRGFLPSVDDPLTLFRSIHDIAATFEAGSSR